jgi:uncharacterized protein (TIGR00255 family)
MTGFGAAEGPVSGGRLRVEIRTVNHRHFNLAPKLPVDLSVLETELRERLRREFDRGHIAVQVRWTELPPRAMAAVTVDLERAKVVASRLRELQSALGLAGDVTLELVARQPDVLTASTDGGPEASWADVEPIVAQAAAECRVMRAREGQALTVELRDRMAAIEELADRVAERAPGRLVRERDRLRAAVAELLDGRPVDDGRLAQEIAFQADRLDITEELVRLRAHAEAVRAALAADRPAGKQLGFLAQELGREVNTIGSKANDAEITRHVIAMKGELEKFREQLENLE